MKKQWIIFVIAGALIAGCEPVKPDHSFLAKEREVADSLNYTQAGTIESSDDFYVYVRRLSYLLKSKRFADVYDYFSPSSVRSKLNKSQFLKSVPKIFPADRLNELTTSLTNVAAHEDVIVTKATANYRSFRIKLKSVTYTFISRLEKDAWVVEELAPWQEN